MNYHDDDIKWKHFPRYWPFVRGIHRSPVNSPHKGQWREALMFFLICTQINGWVNNRKTGDFRRHGAHYDVTVMIKRHTKCVVLKAAIKGRYKSLHPKYIVGCNYLSLPLVHATDTTLLISQYIFFCKNVVGINKINISISFILNPPGPW